MASPLQALRRKGDEDDGEVQLAMEREDLSWGKALKFIGKLLWRHPWLVVFTAVLGVGIAAAEVITLGLIFPFIESLSGGGESLASQSKLAFMVPYFEGFNTVDKVRIIAVGLVAVQVFKGVLQYISGRVTSYQRILLDRDLRQDIFDQIIALELSYINQDKVANLYTILHDYAIDTASSAQVILKGIPKVSSFAGYLVALFLLSWKLTLFALVLAILTTKSINFLINLIRTFSKRINVYRVRLKHVSLEALNGIKVVHLFGREDHARDRFRNELETYQDHKYQRASLKAAVNPVYSTMMMAMFAGILVAGTFVLDTSAATWVALLTMFLVVMSKLMSPTAKYADSKAKLAKQLPSIDQIIEFLDPTGKPYLQDGEREFDRLQRGIRFEHVWFRYAQDEPDVLRGLEFEVPQGATVALVGSSGAGKSTTVDLMARLYDPTEGRIVVDGRNLREYTVRSWRQRIAVVSQETFLFNDTAMENIRYGRLDATDEEVVQAAKKANAHSFLASLPEGYDTMLGERGVRLSGGQAQRVAIARAILADPDLLILDEATSSLDTETERQVQEAIDRVSEERTVVAIAHRLSTIQNADNILVMKEGRVVEQGTHEQLLARRGEYWRYVRMQDLIAQDNKAPFLAIDEPTKGAEGADRIVLRPGTTKALAKNNGTTLGEVRIVPVNGGRTLEDVLERVKGDAVFLREGEDRCTLRLGDELHRDVALYKELAGRKGEADREVRARVRAFETGSS